MDAFEYFGELMKRGAVSTDDLQQAWRFAHDFPQRPYLALMGQQLELPPPVDQGLVLTDALLVGEDGMLDLSTFTVQDLPECVSAEVRTQIAKALAGLRMGQILTENTKEIELTGIDKEALAERLQAIGEKWYLRQL